jgi:hypothetical protein
MKKNKPVFYLVCVFLSLVLVVFITQAGLTEDKLNLQNNILNFNDLQASIDKPDVRSISVLIPLYEEQTEKIALHLKDNFISEGEKKQLPGSRMTVISSRKDFSLSKEQQQVNIKSDKVFSEDQPAVLLELSIMVKPTDLMGKYYSTLIISQPGPKGKKLTTEITVQFRVNPWLHLELESDIHKILTADLSSNNLQSTVPGRMVISGNTPWQLWLTGASKDENYITRDNEIILNIYSEDERLVIHEKNVTLRKKEIMLAQSELMIVDPRKSYELTFDMQIKDFIYLTAGKISFPVNFRLEPIKREE